MTATPSSRPAEPDPPDHEGVARSSTSTGDAFAVPGDLATEGTADAAALAALKARVYSRGGASSPDADADRAELGEWEFRLARERADRIAEERAATSAGVADTGVAVDASDAGDLGDAGSVVGAYGDVPRRRPWHPIVAAVALSAATAIVLGGAVSRFMAATETPGALAIFSRAVTDQDSLTGSLRFTTLGASEIAESRRLANTYGWDIWAVRTDDESLCLYAERKDLTAGACATPLVFATDGAIITLPNSYAKGTEYSDPSVGQAITLSWGPDDTALTFVSAGP